MARVDIYFNSHNTLQFIPMNKSVFLEVAATHCDIHRQSHQISKRTINNRWGLLST